MGTAKEVFANHPITAPKCSNLNWSPCLYLDFFFILRKFIFAVSSSKAAEHYIHSFHYTLPKKQRVGMFNLKSGTIWTTEKRIFKQKKLRNATIPLSQIKNIHQSPLRVLHPPFSAALLCCNTQFWLPGPLEKTSTVYLSIKYTSVLLCTQTHPF